MIITFDHVNENSAYAFARTDSGNYISKRIIEGAYLRKLKVINRFAPWKAFNRIKKDPGWSRIDPPPAGPDAAGRSRDIKELIKRLDAKLKNRRK